ncbi:hypothetical protein ACFPPD_09905 [Cohnella suwonensis]|uniref:Peptidase M10 metallopeptidase domain-containing protein n=1 Tax=Cohnella suwonensis TaxID=696072 RepID=A0ABW0LVI6_9BACL
MKRKAKSGFIATIVALSAITLPTISYADLEDEAAFWTSGFPSSIISHIDYWEQSTIASLGYDYYTANSRADWALLPNSDVAYYKTTSQADADLRFFAGDYGSDYWGFTKAYLSNGTEVINVEDGSVWYKCQILLNDGQMDRDNFTNSNRHHTTLHEVGHALSLAHQFAPTDSAMKQGQLTYTDPTSLDSSNIQWKY